MTKIQVSVIILNHNGGDVTERCINGILSSVIASEEIILIDNGSELSEYQKLKIKYAKRIKIIRNEVNYGYPKGNNQGAQIAKGRYLIFLNNDTVVPKGWIMPLIKILDQNPDIAFLQPKIKSLTYRNFFEYAGGTGGFLDYFGFPFVRGRIFGSIEEDVGQYNDQRNIFWASGVALACRKKIFQELGMFDPFFFSYGEEADLCFRAHRKGYRVVYTPEVEILHLGGFTSNRNISQKIFFHHRNHILLLLKNLKIRDLLFILPCRLLFDITAVIYYLYYYRSLSIASVVLKAYLSIVKNLRKICCHRYSYSLNNFGYPKFPGLVYKGSIVWNYFILKKKRWSEIYNLKFRQSKIIKIF